MKPILKLLYDAKNSVILSSEPDSDDYTFLRQKQHLPNCVYKLQDTSEPNVNCEAMDDDVCSTKTEKEC